MQLDPIIPTRKPKLPQLQGYATALATSWLSAIKASKVCVENAPLNDYNRTVVVCHRCVYEAYTVLRKIPQASSKKGRTARIQGNRAATYVASYTTWETKAAITYC